MKNASHTNHGVSAPNSINMNREIEGRCSPRGFARVPGTLWTDPYGWIWSDYSL